MDRGIYAASSGGLLSAKKIEIVSNNLANVNTVGYKAEHLATRQQAFSDTLASKLPGVEGKKGDFDRVPGVVQVGTVTDFTPGPVSYTGDPLSVALSARHQFFAVNTPQGELYTRAGNFARDAEGNLVTLDGFPVLGDGGPIVLPPGNASINGAGMIYVNNQPIGRLRVVEVEDVTKLERMGSARFRLTGGGSVNTVEAAVIPESVEMANVQTVEGMIDLISVNKAFEAYTKTVKTIDELNDRSTRMARLSS